MKVFYYYFKKFRLYESKTKKPSNADGSSFWVYDMNSYLLFFSLLLFFVAIDHEFGFKKYFKSNPTASPARVLGLSCKLYGRESV